MEIIIKKFLSLNNNSNVYLIHNENNCIMIDAGGDYNKINDYIIKNNLNLKAILFTHAHFDHMINANNFSCKKYGTHNDLMLFNSGGMAQDFDEKIVSVNIDKYIMNEEILEIDGIKIEVILTPGHTAGSCCYKIDKFLFTGDTLFLNDYGRTDLYSGNESDIISSIKKLLSLDNNLIVYPGHGLPTTIHNEKIFFSNI